MTGLLLRVRQLCNEGLFLRAYEVARPLGPLPRWEGTRPRLLAARLAFHLGAPDLARRLTLAAHRCDPREPAGLAALAGVMLELRGPLETWERTGRPAFVGLPAPAANELAGFRAQAAILLRDFEAAREVLDEASEHAPNDARLTLRRSMWLGAQDRYDEALDVALREVELRPGAQATVRWAAHLLVLVGRRDDAMALLTAAAASMQCAAVVVALAALQGDAGRHDERAASLQRFVELSPLLSEAPRAALEAELAEVAYRRGNLDAAITHARRSGVPSALRIAENLARGGPPRQVTLDVPFVRQHRLTCVPATLAAIARFWRRPAEHLAVAEAICHDGTPAHSERRWAQENGWECRELTVTWEAALALLDRGVPIALHTHAALSGHCQAIIGYDARRGTLTVRDPHVARDLEVLGDELLTRHQASGPRGLALVPALRAGLLADLPLPDASLYDRLHVLHCALDGGDREAAGEEAGALATEAPDHVVTLAARRALAVFDDDWPELLAVARRALALHPGDPRAQLDVLSALRHLGSPAARVAWLGAICAEPGCDPIFFARLALELADDRAALPRATRLARRAVREPHPGAEALAALASLLWQGERHDEALRAFRFAACTEDRNERFARMFFSAAAAGGPDLVEAALGWLYARRRRFGRHGAGAAVTQAWALSQLDRSERALDLLDEALALVPDEPEAHALRVRCLRRLGASERAFAAAQAFVRCARDSSEAQRALAGTCLALGDREGAAAAFTRALTLQPDDAPSAVDLFELQLARGDATAAAEALDALTRCAPSAATVLAIRLALFRDDAAAALAHLERLCTARGTLASHLWSARRALIFAGLGEQTQQILALLAVHPRAHAEVAHIVACTRAARATTPER